MQYKRHENLCRTGPDLMEINSEDTNPNPGKRISLPDVSQPVPFLPGGGSESGKRPHSKPFPEMLFSQKRTSAKKKKDAMIYAPAKD